MKSSIKIDVDLNGKAFININAFESWEDLRDKAINMFLNETGRYMGGRLCFIDSSGSKQSGSAGSENLPSNFAIHPINPEYYEILQRELELLIKERNERFPSYLSDSQKEKITAILADEFEYNKVMNY